MHKQSMNRNESPKKYCTVVTNNSSEDEFENNVSRTVNYYYEERYDTLSLIIDDHEIIE